MNDRGIALGLVMSAGVGIMALMVMNRKNTRYVETWQRNEDGSCTFFYDDGSTETAVCTDPPL